MSFKHRILKMTFTLGTGTFGSTGKNQSTLSGLRMRAQISRAGGPAMSTASLDVFGMELSMMNQLSTLGLIATTLRRNSVLVEAGDSDGTAAVFQGTITNAYGDFNSAPDVPFRVEAHTGLIDAIAPSPPQSFEGPVDAATILSGIAAKMGVPFENNGVSVILASAYYYGALRQQALNVVKDAGIAWNGMEDGTLAIWMPGKSRGGQVPLISPETGMVGYPSFNGNGVMLRTLFNPAITFGNNIKVQSSLPGACGLWHVYSLNHDLECEQPHGSWFSDVQGSPPGSGPQTP